MMIRLWFYRERGNMDPGYCTGSEDIRRRVKFESADDLKRCREALLHGYEGETFSAWVCVGARRSLLCSGAFDPADIDTIMEEFEKYGGKTK